MPAERCSCLCGRRRPLVGAIAAVIGYFAAYELFGGLSSDWIDHFGRRSGGELLLITAGVFAPAFAVLLTVPSRRER